MTAPVDPVPGDPPPAADPASADAGTGPRVWAERITTVVGAVRARAAAYTEAPRPLPARLPVLDGLRILGLLMVLAYDYTAAPGGAWGTTRPSAAFPGWSHLTTYGFLGAELCFLVSGFAVGLVPVGRRPIDFLARRLGRLYPAYAVAVVLTALVVTALPQYMNRPPLSEIAVNLSMAQEPWGAHSIDAGFWVLWVELRFYLLFALFVLFRGFSHRRVLVFVVGWIILSLVAEMLHGFPEAALVPAYAPYFIAGLVFAVIRRTRPSPLLWTLVVVAFLMAQHDALGRLLTVHQATGWHAGYTTVLLLEALFFAVLAAVACGWLSLLRFPALTRLARGAYPCYLLHTTIGLTLIRVLHRHVPAVPLVLLLTVVLYVVGLLVHRLVERPFGPRIVDVIHQGLAEARRQDAKERGRPPRDRDTARAAAPSSATPAPRAPLGGPPPEASGRPTV